MEKILKRLGRKKKDVTASVTIRFRATPDQALRFKRLASLRNKDLSKVIIFLLEKESKKI